MTFRRLLLVCIPPVGRRRKTQECTQISISTVNPHPLSYRLHLLTKIDMGSKGEVRINQAKRGYDVTGDGQGLIWVNP